MGKGAQILIPESVVVRPISRAQWAALRDEYPLTDDDGFPQALIAACTGMSLFDAQIAWDEWPTIEAEELFDRCLEVAQPEGWEWARERLINDPRLMAEMLVCQEYRIPRSQFLAWSEEDQDFALAAYFETQDKCPGCGGPGEAMENANLAEIVSKRCWKCVELATVRKDMPERDQGVVHLTVRRKVEK